MSSTGTLPYTSMRITHFFIEGNSFRKCAHLRI